VSELKTDFNVVFGSFTIIGGKIIHEKGVLKIGPIE
jgi:hypothetical protein